MYSSLLQFLPPTGWFTIGIILLSCVYIYFRICYNFWNKQGIKQLKPIPLFGNYMGILLGRKSLSEFFEDSYNKFPEEPYIGVYELTRPVLIVRDPELIKHILVTDFSSFQNRGVQTYEDIDPLSANLLFLNSEKWHALRTKLTPAFTSKKMRTMFQLMFECAEELLEVLEKPAKGGEMFDISEHVINFAVNIVGSCAFGIQFNAIKDEKSDFRLMSKRVTSSSLVQSLKHTIASVCPFLLRLLNIKITPPGVTDFFVEVVKETVKYREQHNVVRNDFIDLLIQLKNKGILSDGSECTREGEIATNKTAQIEFTETLLTAQAFVFFQAGSDTTANTITFCLYELVLNPKIQKKLREEIQHTVKQYDGKLTYEALQKMTYLERVIDETLRKYPPVSFTARVVLKPYTIPGTSIKLNVGQRIFIPIYGLHHDPKYFPEPSCFNPENFSIEAKSSRSNYTFLPFGEGPRICIGMRFAYLEAKIALAVLLLNFEFSNCEKTKFPIKFDTARFITTSKDGIWLKIKKIN